MKTGMATVIRHHSFYTLCCLKVNFMIRKLWAVTKNTFLRNGIVAACPYHNENILLNIDDREVDLDILERAIQRVHSDFPEYTYKFTNNEYAFFSPIARLIGKIMIREQKMIVHLSTGGLTYEDKLFLPFILKNYDELFRRQESEKNIFMFINLSQRFPEKIHSIISNRNNEDFLREIQCIIQDFKIQAGQ